MYSPQPNPGSHRAREFWLFLSEPQSDRFEGLVRVGSRDLEFGGGSIWGTGLNPNPGQQAALTRAWWVDGLKE